MTRTSTVTLSTATRLPSYSQWDPAPNTDPPDYHSHVHGPLFRDSPNISYPPLPLCPPDNSSQAYFYSSKRVAINLGPKRWETPSAAFGMNATVVGSVGVRHPSDVESVVITVEGYTITTAKYPGGIAFPQATCTVLHIKQALYNRCKPSSHHSAHSLEHGSPNAHPISSSESHSIRSSQHRDYLQLLFSVQLPKDRSLPPTFSETHLSISAHVQYQVRVDVVRKGIAWRDRLVAPILYLPKSMPPHHYHLVDPLPQNFNWKLRSDHDSLQWNSVNAECDDPSVKGLAVKLHLAYPLVYKSGSTILYRVSMHYTPSLDDAIRPSWWSSLACTESLGGGDRLQDYLTVSLPQLVTITSQGKRVRREVGMGKGMVSKVVSPKLPTADSDIPSPTSLLISGAIEGGQEGGEMTWAVPGLIDVDYAVRLSFKIPASSTSFSFMSPKLECTQVIGLTTHSREDIVFDESGFDEPALGLMRDGECVKYRRRPRITLGRLKH